MSFPRYPEYKDSGVEWLGEVPGHWHIDRFKRSISSCQNGIWGSEPAGDENDLPCVRVADFDRVKLVVNDEIPTIRNATPREQENRVLRRGNLVLEKSGGGDKQLVGCVVLYDADTAVVCSNFVARIELERSMVPSYWRYAHAAAYAVRLNYGSIKQTSGIQNLDQDAYFDERSAFPPPDEQAAIAAFLDRETAKIDALVAEQQNLIALLKEKRQALISHAVTKGLDPDVPMKDSGVAWLGEVPAHWDVRPLKYAAQVGNGSTPNRNNPSYWMDGEYPWLNSSVANRDQVIEAEQFVTPLALQECHLPIIEPPAILVGITGQGRTRGMATTLMIEATINQHLAFVKPIPASLDIRFLRRVFDMAYQHLRTESEEGGSTKGAITCDQISRLAVPMPDMDEQAALANFLDQEVSKLNGLMNEAEIAVAFLQERRTALISAAVTGKIDVRRLAVASADPTPEPA